MPWQSRHAYVALRRGAPASIMVPPGRVALSTSTMWLRIPCGQPWGAYPRALAGDGLQIGLDDLAIIVFDHPSQRLAGPSLPL